MVNKKVVIIVSIIAIILVSTVVYISFKSLDKEYIENENKSENYGSEQDVNSATSNDIQENKLNQENNNNEDKNENKLEEQENEIENTESETQENKNETSNNDIQEEKKDGDEKAIALVKKKWGESDDTVYYNIEEQISDNVYIVSVRDSETTEDLSEYRVDIKTNKVKKE